MVSEPLHVFHIQLEAGGGSSDGRANQSQVQIAKETVTVMQKALSELTVLDLGRVIAMLNFDSQMPGEVLLDPPVSPQYTAAYSCPDGLTATGWGGCMQACSCLYGNRRA
ncbi:hypothetical protein NKDENANG_01233 [Candidatus Entotheonellaceae bacterium PAL068K]